MGTDIHVVIQFLNSKGEWEDTEQPKDSPLENRNYTWFTFLDGCRSQVTNQDRGLGIVPMLGSYGSQNYRGVPPGFATEPYGDYEEAHDGKWMGYGVANWCTLQELLDHAEAHPNRHNPTDKIEWLQKFTVPLRPDHVRIVWGYDS